MTERFNRLIMFWNILPEKTAKSETEPKDIFKRCYGRHPFGDEGDKKILKAIAKRISYGKWNRLEEDDGELYNCSKIYNEKVLKEDSVKVVRERLFKEAGEKLLTLLGDNIVYRKGLK